MTLAADRAKPLIPALPLGPSPSALTTASFLLRPTRFLDRASALYGDYFTVKLSANRTLVVSSDPAAVKAAFSGDPETMRAGEGNAVLKPILGASSLLLLDGAAHMRQRKLLLPAFHGESMRAYENVIREAAERRIQLWPDGDVFSAQPSMQDITLDVILRVVLGVTDDAELRAVGAPLKALLDATASRPRLMALQMTSSDDPPRLSPWARFNRLIEAADHVIYQQIHARRRGMGPGDDMLSMLIDARDDDGQGMTDLELRDELLTLLLAGHETTATALSWTLELLSKHRNVRGRLADSLAQGDEAYLSAVINESLRIRPVVPAVARYLTEPLELPSRTLPAGVHLTPSIYLLHRRRDLYPDPESFRPERFLGQRPSTYEWIPFGGGVRRCLGASFALFEMKVVLSTVLERVDLISSPFRFERVTRRAITFAPQRGARIAIGAQRG